ncbi:MAG: cation:proton antiporter [Burkholderiales bacterium]
MDSLPFLPNQWLPTNPMVLVGAMVMLALLGGELAARYFRLPRITGYAVTGMLLGASGLFPPPLAEDLRIFVDISLGLVLFELGSRIDLAWLKRAPMLAVMAIVESAATGGLLFFVLTAYFDFAPSVAVVGAAIGISTSPAVVMRVAADSSAQGQVTERMLLLAAINSTIAVLVLTTLVPVMAADPEGGIFAAIARPIYVLTGSILLAAFLIWFGLLVLRLTGKREDRQFIATLGLVIVAVGLAGAWNLSVLVTLLALGAGLRIFDRNGYALAIDFGVAGQFFYLVLFTLVGASLDLRAVATAGVAAVVFVLVRFAGKGIAVMAFSRATHQPVGQAALLCLAIQPMSGLAAVLVHDAAVLHRDIAGSIAPVVLAAIVLLEILGPIATQVALRLAGEAQPQPA